MNLRSVGVLAPVGHRHEEGSIVLRQEGLIVEGAAVDGLATGAVVVDEVAALDHEVLDHPVEEGPLVVQRLPGRLPDAGFSGDELPEVFGRLRNEVGKELDDDAAEGDVAHGDVEEDPRSHGFGHLDRFPDSVITSRNRSRFID